MFSKVQTLFAFPAFTGDDLRLMAMLSVFACLFAVEAKYGRREQKNRTVRRSYLTNTGLFLLNDTMMSLLSISSLYLVADNFAQWGVLGSFADSVWKAVPAFVLLDLVLYGWHRACHRVEALWMFHKVHHSDLCMNVSTALRLHIGEVLLTTLVKAAFIVVLGVDSSIVLANEAIITLFVLFHHTNASLPGERRLSRLIVSPSIHRLHHSVHREEHDRNYGAVFTLWDKLFGTFAELVPERLGLHFVKEQSLVDLMKFGFIWRYAPNQQAVQSMIAEAAYYRAERRGFTPGCDYRDWLEAEREIYQASGQ